MAKVTELRDFTLGVRASPKRDGFVITLEHPITKDVLWFDLSRDIANEVVAKLTGGVAIARDIPR